ncbi:hypothetical protein AGABI2DRAFT_195685 [Agaricus bisporus var. bisporus H97]|uniref:hypothetical protein n=1 Tax=Agaricus bisporus var. bisporus (strain H97 / ATCC MYA-4626 / FGSC 10389) TaxID=936046 RepID=UPI00029F5DF2|nr:hypothetical protein AGABI2DRAFT_195685 [Agaricus bisporus var. bisporus H97]EKV42333.1 hypothetical protein AGABI2DRAFT_195685 [Agaricus bisporus var. bisporus H97]
MASESSQSKVLPKGYTFMGPELFVSENAKAMVLDLLKNAEKRNPDAFDMYVYNDFHAYAIHDLIDKTFASIKKTVNKKEWVEAFYAIEALTVFFEFESTWTTCDDGDLTKLANKLYGAILLTILKGLKDTNQLSPKKIPNLECVLRAAFEFGKNMEGIACKSDYTTTCKAIANDLFKDTMTADRALYEARLREYVESIEDPEEKIELLESLEEYVEEMKEQKVAWYMKGKASKPEIKNVNLQRAWNDYKGQAPEAPIRGPAEWDLTKWTEEDKSPFSFGNMDDELGI